MWARSRCVFSVAQQQLSFGRQTVASMVIARRSFAQTQRIMLNMLKPAPGSTSKPKRMGRGKTRGKTCGKGHKGQGARGGIGKILFEGGQTPMHIRTPKRGFTNNFFKRRMEPLNLEKLQDYISMGKILPNEVTDKGIRLITMRDLQLCGLIGGIEHGVKLLGDGAEHLSTPLHLEVSKASKSAVEAVERAGGTVTCAHYNRLALRALLKPQKFHPARVPRRARPPPKLMPYYLDYDTRGEFNPKVQMRNSEMKLYKDAIIGGKVIVTKNKVVRPKASQEQAA